MGILKWYKRDPRAFLSAVTGMKPDEIGIYAVLLEVLYCRDGALPDDKQTYHHLLTDARVWRRVRGRLLSLGKIYLSDGFIRNERVDNEIRYAVARAQLASSSGIVSAYRKGYRIEKPRNGEFPRSTDLATNHNHIERKRVADNGVALQPSIFLQEQIKRRHS